MKILCSNYKWSVFGEYGGNFNRLEDAKKCAQEASKYPEHDYQSSVYNNSDGSYYIDYEHGKLVRDGWSLPKCKRTGKKKKFKIDGRIVEKPIYLDSQNREVIKHGGKIILVGK